MPDPRVRARYSVTVRGAGTIEGDEGRRLVLALEDAGIDILHRCGGNTRCATCRVEIHGGDPGPVTSFEERRLAELSTRKESTRLSCQVQVRGPLDVEVRQRLSAHPEMSDPGPRPIEWPIDGPLPPDSDD